MLQNSDFYVTLFWHRSCSFLTKIIAVEKAGAAAALVYDNDPTSNSLIDMISDGTGRETSIPCVFLSYKDGQMIRESLLKNRLTFAYITMPLNLTYRHERTLRRAPWSLY